MNKKFQSALFSPLGRWTGNNFLFEGGLRPSLLVKLLSLVSQVGWATSNFSIFLQTSFFLNLERGNCRLYCGECFIDSLPSFYLFPRMQKASSYKIHLAAGLEKCLYLISIYMDAPIMATLFEVFSYQGRLKRARGRELLLP